MYIVRAKLQLVLVDLHVTMYMYMCNIIVSKLIGKLDYNYVQ